MANLFDDANAPETEPAIIVAGDQVKWKRTDLGTDYPPGHIGAPAGGSKKPLIFQRDTAFQLALRLTMRRILATLAVVGALLV